MGLSFIYKCSKCCMAYRTYDSKGKKVVKCECCNGRAVLLKVENVVDEKRKAVHEERKKCAVKIDSEFLLKKK